MNIFYPLTILSLTNVFEQTQKQRVHDAVGTILLDLEIFHPHTLEHIPSLQVAKHPLILKLQKKSKHLQHQHQNVFVFSPAL